MTTSMRMSDHMRRKIHTTLINRLPKDDWEKLVADSAKLADDCWRLYYGKDLKAINKIPDGWLPTKDAILVHFGSSENSIKLHFNGMSRFMPDMHGYIKKENLFRRFTYADYHGQAELRIKKDERLFHEYTRIAAKGTKLEKDKEETSAQIWGALEAMNTTKQLFERWPEVQAVVEQLFSSIMVPTANLPVPQLGELNKKLSLVA